MFPSSLSKHCGEIHEFSLALVSWSHGYLLTSFVTTCPVYLALRSYMQ